MPVLSHNDSFLAFGVTPNTQKIPVLSSWIVFLLKTWWYAVLAQLNDAIAIDYRSQND
jgi:hypothetical protein